MLDAPEVLAVIPARYASTRLPGKPLALIAGKPMIQHVWERVSAVLPAVVATDDARIADAVFSFGGRVRMTSPDCPNGTARAAEVLAHWEGARPDIVLNVQGDEPLVQAHDLETLVRLMRRPEVRIGTLVTPARAADLSSPNNCFVQRLPDGLCTSFSRSPECCSIQAWRHVGMYGFRADVLPQLVNLQPTPGEVRERLEQLRWHESGFPIYSAEVAAAGIGVDSPEDLEYVRGLMAAGN